jgi:hypothetical protein
MCIVISLVRANDAGQLGDLLSDWRRINVAVSRTKTKLVFVGSARTFRVSALAGESLMGVLCVCHCLRLMARQQDQSIMHALVQLISARGWMHALPPGCGTEPRADGSAPDDSALE